MFVFSTAVTTNKIRVSFLYDPHIDYMYNKQPTYLKTNTQTQHSPHAFDTKHPNPTPHPLSVLCYQRHVYCALISVDSMPWWLDTLDKLTVVLLLCGMSGVPWGW